MKVIGITGGVGSGKSALLHAIAESFSCRLLLADEIANTLKQPGQSCYEDLCALLGSEILDEAGFIDNKKMAALIFGDQALLEKVNALVHPAVKAYILRGIEEERKKGAVEYVFVEAALFIEAGYREMVDSLWYVYADKNVRLRRLYEGRGYTTEKSRSIMDKQLQEEVFRTHCDVVIDNSGSMEETMVQVRKELENR